MLGRFAGNKTCDGGFERREVRCRDSNNASFYSMRYLLFCQSLWSISHNALQATFAPMPSDPIFIEISSSHELGRIEVRLETHLVFLLLIKKVFHSPMNPVDWPCYIFYDGCQDDTHSAFVRNLPEIFKRIYWYNGKWLRLNTQHLSQLEAPHWQPQILYLCYWLCSIHLLTYT